MANKKRKSLELLMAAALAQLESLLRDRKLGHTLSSALVEVDAESVAQTGLASLDLLLTGGFPRGHVSELIGPSSSGRMSVLQAVISRATRAGEVVALIDTLDRLDPVSAAAAGVDLSRVLWIRGCSLSPTAVRSGAFSRAASGSLLHRALDRALKATNLVLQARGFGIVALDLLDMPRQMWRQIPFTTWLRLQRVIEGSETVCLILSSEAGARSAGGVSLHLHRVAANWSGEGPGRVFRGMTIDARVVRARQSRHTQHVTVEFRERGSGNASP